jgi:hypothetical protein
VRIRLERDVFLRTHITSMRLKEIEKFRYSLRGLGSFKKAKTVSTALCICAPVKPKATLV